MTKNQMNEIHILTRKIRKNVDANTISAYIRQFNHALSYKCNDKVCVLMLQLCSLANTDISCMSNLYEDFESNKGMAYVFIMSLMDADPWSTD